MLLDIFPLQGKHINHNYMIMLISNHNNENLQKNRSEIKNVYPAQKHIYNMLRLRKNVMKCRLSNYLSNI